MDTVESDYNGICKSCLSPFFRGDDVKRELVDCASPDKFEHANCTRAAQVSGGWDLLERGFYKLWTAKAIETKMRYFLRASRGDEKIGQISLDSLTRDEHRKKRSNHIDLVKAVIDGRIKQPEKCESFFFAVDVRRTCGECSEPIIENEAYYYSGVSGNPPRHTLHCQPENWTQTRPKKGGGVLYIPRKSLVLTTETAATGLQYSAILHKTRKVGGQVKRYFSCLTDSEYAVAVGRLVNVAACDWMRDSVSEPVREMDSHHGDCPRCGRWANSRGKEKMICGSCKYEYPIPEKNRA